jgi:methionyl-tRNA synthetase
MDAASEVNAYLNANEPWKVFKADPGRASTVLWVAIQAISAIRVALAPYLPFTTETLGSMLGLPPEIDTWSRPLVRAGSPLGDIAPLFTKLDDDVLDD